MVSNEQKILNLFLDNVTSDITAADMRTFVSTIWDDKEFSVQKVINTQPGNWSMETVSMNDLVVIAEDNDPNKLNGLYLAMKDKPLLGDLRLITSNQDIINVLEAGEDGKVLGSLSGDLVWVDNDSTGYYIQGTDTIYNIVRKTPFVTGETWISSTSDTLSNPAGIIGDGYTYAGEGIWRNVGQLQGPAGPQGVQGIPGPTSAISPVVLYNDNHTTGEDTFTFVYDPTLYLEMFINGAKIREGTYLCTSGTEVVLTTPLQANSWINIVQFCCANPISGILPYSSGLVTSTGADHYYIGADGTGGTADDERTHVGS